MKIAQEKSWMSPLLLELTWCLHLSAEALWPRCNPRCSAHWPCSLNRNASRDFFFIVFPHFSLPFFCFTALTDLLQHLLDLSLAKLDRKKLWHIIIKIKMKKKKKKNKGPQLKRTRGPAMWHCELSKVLKSPHLWRTFVVTFMTFLYFLIKKM